METEWRTCQGFLDWTIHRAVSSTPWPGHASLEIAKLWMSLASWHGQKCLGGRWVGGVDEMLYRVFALKLGPG